MAILLSTTVTEAQTGAWPQLMTIVQEFDQPIVTTEDFKVIFYAKNDDTPNVLGQMTVAPIQYVPNQLTYTVQVSPFASGALGVYAIIGGIQDIYGNSVDLKIGDDFSIYNTTIKPYLPNVRIAPDSSWDPGVIIPATAICPQNTAPKVSLEIGPWTSAMAIPEGMWNEGNFYIWLNYTWLPDRESEGIPFVWEPPFYYSFSQFGFPITETLGPFIPPYPFDIDTILSNITSSGPSSQGVWDTCGWIEQYPKWRGKVQMWVFGDDAFGTGVAPFPNFPATVGPDGRGDLSPQAIFGFPADSQLQFYAELPFSYIAPNP